MMDVNTSPPRSTLVPHVAEFGVRGPINQLLLGALTHPVQNATAEIAHVRAGLGEALTPSPGLLNDHDLQLTLFLLDGLHYLEQCASVIGSSILASVASPIDAELMREIF
jgi:hypothetical protein